MSQDIHGYAISFLPHYVLYHLYNYYVFYTYRCFLALVTQIRKKGIRIETSII